MKLKRRNSFPMYPCYFYNKENRIVGLPIYVQDSISKTDTSFNSNKNQTNNIFTIDSHGGIKPLVKKDNNIMDVRLDPNYYKKEPTKNYSFKKKGYDDKTRYQSSFKRNENWRKELHESEYLKKDNVYVPKQFHTKEYSNKEYTMKQTLGEPLLKKKFKKQSIICSNCRKKGHFQRQCKRPIRSYGIVAFRNSKNLDSKTPKLEVLLIRRIHSIGFETFIRGRYNSLKEMQALIDRMIEIEKIKVKTKTFDELWDDICINKNTYFYRSGKKSAFDKFNNLNIQELFKDVSSPWREPGWGFPKGRRQLYETERECAIREFGEETDYRPNQFNIFMKKPFIETYVGTNNVRYCHNYFIAMMDDSAPDARINQENLDQITEVGDIRWFNQKDALEIMKPYDIQKKDVLNQVYNYIETELTRPKDHFKRNINTQNVTLDSEKGKKYTKNIKII
jgi:8-oxo-dGTP pyrophosphatase MutT (NUDIX family)